MTRFLETDTLSNQDITSVLEIGSYTADADRLICVQLFIDEIAGDGNYVFYVTLQIAGAGAAYRFIPITTAAAANGLTAIGGQAILVPVRSGDVVKVYVTGLAGDDTTPDTTVRWFELAALRPTTADRTLDVTAAGEAGIDWANIGNPATVQGLSGTTVKAVTDEVDVGKVKGAAVAGVADFKADVSNLDAAMTTRAPASEYDTEMARITADVATEAKQDIVDGIVDAILLNTGTDGVVVASHTAAAKAEIQAECDTAVAALNDPTAASIADAICDELLADHTGAGSLAKTISDTLDSIGDPEWGLGSGGITFTYTLTSSVDGAPIADCWIGVYTDAAMTNLIASGYTDSDGAITFYLDAGTRRFKRQKSGWNFDNPDTEVVSELLATGSGTGTPVSDPTVAAITFGELREVSVYAEVDRSKWPEPTVNAWLRDAIRDYSVHFPRYIDTGDEGTNITCGDDVQEYSLSSFAGIQTILDVEYPEGEDPPDLLERRDQDDPRGFEGLEVYAVRGFGKPDTLRLGEEPDTGEEIRLTYLADHTVPTADITALTIPDRHLDALILFVQWREMRATVGRLMTNPDPNELELLKVLLGGKTLPEAVKEARRAYEDKIAEYKETQVQVGDASIPLGALRDRWAQETWA